MGRALSVLRASLNNQSNIQEMAKERKEAQDIEVQKQQDRYLRRIRKEVYKQEVGSQILQHLRQPEIMNVINFRRIGVDHNNTYDMSLQPLDGRCYFQHRHTNIVRKELQRVIIRNITANMPLEDFEVQGTSLPDSRQP